MSSPDPPPTPDAEAGPDLEAEATDGAPVSAALASVPDVTAEEIALVAEPPTLCLNCGSRLPGQFCPRCGQRQQTLRVPLHRFLRDGFTELFGIDGRVWKTYGTLLFKPGRLTTDYFKGRRQRSLSPVRVYIVSTLVFFVLLSVVDPAGKLDNVIQTSDSGIADSSVVVRDHLARTDSVLAEALGERAARAAVADSVRTPVLVATYRRDSLAAAQAVDRWQRARDAAEGDRRDALSDSLRSARDRLDDVEDVEERIEDTVHDALDAAGVGSGWGDWNDGEIRRLQIQVAILGALPPDSTVGLIDLHQAATQVVPNVQIGSLPDWLTRSAASRGLRDARSGTDVAKAGTELLRAAISHLPTALFLLLPVFALLLKVLYARRGWFYSEHVVFGLHVHAFAFAILSVWMLVLATGVGGGVLGTLAAVLASTIPIYFLIAQKRVYGQGWGKTLLKSVVLGSVYLQVVAALGLTLATLLAFFQG